MLVRLPLRYLLESSLGKDCHPKDTNSVLKCTLSLDCGLWVMVIGYGYGFGLFTEAIKSRQSLAPLLLPIFCCISLICVELIEIIYLKHS